MAVALMLAAFVLAILGTRNSLGWGLSAVLAIGYFNGVLRANFLSVWTTFMFDAAVLGMYLVFLARPEAAGIWKTPASRWLFLLCLWPSMLCLIPRNDMLVQLVALRATIWYLPVLLIATRLTSRDLQVITRVLAVLNLAAFAVGCYLYVVGVPALYPENAVTQIMYRSNDVAGGHHRIPATFLSAHQYGGTSGMTLVFLLGRLLQPGVSVLERTLLAAGSAAAVGGVLLCAARQPALAAGLMFLIAWILSGFSLRFGSVLVVLVGSAVFVALSDERLQRLQTLENSDEFGDRLEGSANAGFIDLMVDYPIGAGLGCAVGTSIPFFLADSAPEQIGLESEYSRLLVDQGMVGLGLWIGFILWMYNRPPKVASSPWRIGILMMYTGTGIAWMTALVGGGVLSSVPSSVLLLLQMGVLAAVRDSRGKGTAA